MDGLSKEEWQSLNNLLSFQPDEDLPSQSGKDMQNMTQRMVIVSVGQAAARIININETEIVCGRFEQLQVSAKFKHRSIYCDVTLKFYGLSAPEGPLCQVCFGIFTFLATHFHLVFVHSSLFHVLFVGKH